MADDEYGTGDGATRIKERCKAIADAAIADAAPVALPKGPKDAPPPLGQWADDLRGCPNAMLRSELFCAGKPPTRREFFERMQLAQSLAPYTVKYTGPRLYQPDMDVWLELVHRARQLPAGCEVSFSARAMLRSLGRSDGKSDRDWLAATFARLRATALDISRKDPQTGRTRGYIRGLVKSLDYHSDQKVWSACLDPEITTLFAPDLHTWIDTKARQELRKSYLAQWLHAYFSSHRKPRPISVKRLHELSGSANAALRDFRRRLREAMTHVAFVEQAAQRKFEWKIDEADLVHVVRESGN